jgi:fatty acid desaturase
VAMVRGDIKAIKQREARVLSAWLLHGLGIIPVIWVLASYSTMPFWVYFLAGYFGFGLLKIRTYLEHRASENPKGRTVIITDRGLFALLFLNNNFHAVHHNHPGAPWYRMRALYDANPETYLQGNDGYFYPNYWQVFRKYLFWAKDPVPHPLWKPVD